MAMRFSAQLWTDGTFSKIAMRGQMTAQLPVGRHYTTDRRECGYAYLTEMTQLHGTELWSLSLECGRCGQAGGAVGTDSDERPVEAPTPAVLVPLAAQLELPLGCTGRCRRCLKPIPTRHRQLYCGTGCRQRAYRERRTAARPVRSAPMTGRATLAA